MLSTYKFPCFFLRPLSAFLMSPNDHLDVQDDEAPGTPISVPDSGDTGEGGKIKMIVQLVKKCLGVKDIAAMCVGRLILAIGLF